VLRDTSMADAAMLRMPQGRGETCSL